MQITPSQEIKTKIFTSALEEALEKQLAEFLSSEAMKEAFVLDIKYSAWPDIVTGGLTTTYSAFLIYK